jgi:alcohol dehydrogenase class IV
VSFGRGVAAEASKLIGEGYVLLSTARAERRLPAVRDGAAMRLQVGSGRVDELAGALLERLDAGATLLVALGGGRVIDTAKALAAARPGDRVAAIPTTLSAAEMTRVHRHATSVPADTPRVRPVIVINDPALSASQPDDELAASCANALAHAVEAPLTPQASPVPVLAALAAARELAAGWRPADTGGPVDRQGLALGALLSGYAIDACGYGLHHVLAQTLVREAGAAHGQANAALLPHTIVALARRAPEAIARLADQVEQEPVVLAQALAARAGASRLRDLGLDHGVLDACTAAAVTRPELLLTPPAAEATEIRDLYESAW